MKASISTGNKSLPHNSFRVHSLKRKMIALTIMLLAALTAALTYVSFIGYREDALTRSASMLQDTVEQVCINIENYFDEINRVSMQLFYNSTILDALAAEPTNVALNNLEKRRLLEGELKQKLILSRNDILSCYIVADEVYRVAQKPKDMDLDKDYLTAAWYEDALNGQSYALLVSDASESRMVCSIVRRMTHPSNYKKLIGILKINFSYNGIAKICDIVQSEYSGQLCIVSETGKPVYGAMPEDIHLETLETKDGVSCTDDTQPQYMVNQVSVPTVGWRVMLFHSVPLLEAGARLTMLQMVAVSVICLMIASGILLLFMRSFLTPLSAVIRSMQSIRNGAQDQRVPLSRSDEIGYLAISFNEMLDRIKATQDENTQLFKEVYEAELLQRDIQQEVLSRQIEPHFIFNTLNMIAIEAQLGQTDQCVENIGRLSSLLRALAHHESSSTLGSEVALIQNYLILYQNRYADRLSYTIDISSEFNPIPFPPLSLQPLVENAIMHGCEAVARHTHIAIVGRAEGNLLLLTVADNACGIPAEKLQAIIASLNGGEGSGIGIPNVHRRIKLFYGDEYGLSLTSGSGGTAVLLRIPLHPAERKRVTHV